MDTKLIDIEYGKQHNSEAEREDVENIIAYVNENLDKHITLKDLYKKYYINVQKIEKLFNKYLNVSYKQYVQNQKYNFAKYKLKFTELSLEEIAEKTGYTSIQSFSKFFKKMSGTSPMAFRKEQIKLRKEDCSFDIN